MRRHLGAVVFLAVVAVVSLYRLCLVGDAPYDARFADRFRPWAASAAAAAPTHPNIAALHPDAADPLDRYRAYYAREMNEDLDLFVWPDHEFVRRSIRSGALPLWRPGIFGGVPEAAAGSPTIYSPLSWPAFVLPLVAGRTVELLLHLLLAGVGFYAFLIDRRRSRAAAALGAAVYMLNPIFTVYLYYGDFVPVFALAPLALVVIRRLFDSPAPWRPAAALAALTALELLSGNAQFGLYALGLQGVAALAGRGSDGKRARAWAWIAGATVVGIVAASIQLVPLAEIAALAARTPDKYAATNSLPPAALLAWPFPSLFGHPAHGDYVGGFLFFRHYSGLYGVSTGAVSLALAIHGAASRRRVAVALGAIVVALVALSAPPVHAAVAAVVPGFDGLHVTRILVVAYFLQALLAADGADAILEARHSPRLALLLPLLMLALVVALELGRVAAGSGAGRFWLHVRYLARHGTLLTSPRILVPLALAGVVALLAYRRWRWTQLALPALAAVEVIALALPNFVGAPARDIRPPTEIVSRLRAAVAANPGRVVGLTEADSFPPALGDHLPANSAAADGFADLRAFLRIPPAPMTELVASAAPSGSFEYFAVRDVDRPLFDLLDVRYVLSSHPLDPARFSALAPGLYENPRARGRAFFTRCAIVEPDAEKRLARLTARDFSPWSAAILAAPVPLAPTCTADDAPFAIAVVDAGATRVRLEVDAPADGVVVLADAWFPGWRVTVDGVPGELLRVDHALNGVLVASGRHAIEFHFAPDALADGAWLSLVAWLLIAAAAAWDRLRRLRLSDDALIALGAGALLLAFCGRDLLPNDNDALYAGVIRTLRHGGSFIDLRLGTVPFLDKPPLFFWLGALVTAVAGESALVLRLVPIAAGILGAVLVARTTRRLTGSRAAAVFAAFALATAPNYYEYARRVYMEVPTAVLGFWAFDLGVRERWKRAGVTAGLAFMLKSVVGVLGFGALAVAHLVRRRLPRGLVIAGAIALAIVVPWHLMAWHANPTAFIDFTLNLHLKHQIAEAQPWSRGGPLFYFEVLAVQDTVIGICLVAGAIVAARDFKRTRDFELGALLLAVALQLALYTLSATKKPFYLLTLYPFAAVLGARALAPFLHGKIGALVAAALVLIFVAKDGALLHPSLDERESTYVAPLARRMSALAPPGAPLYSYETYLAAPQYYSGRDTIYALGDAPTVAMLSRIPYLRYAHDVIVWSDDILRGGAWVLAPIDRAAALIARAPGTQVIARNQGFALLQGPSAKRRLGETRRRWETALAQRPTAADSYAAVEDGPSAAAWAELLIAAGVPAPVMLARGESPAADCRLLIAFDPARAAAAGRVTIVVEPGGAPAAAASARLGAAILPLAAEPAHARTVAGGDRALLVAADGTIYATLHAAGDGVVVRFGLDLAALVYRLRQGDPSRANRDSDGNGALQPADLLPPIPAHADDAPFADDAVDALFAAIDAASPCRLPRTRGLPDGVARLVVLTADQDYVADEIVDSMAAMLARAHASATFLLTDPGVGAHPDLNVAPDGSTPRLAADRAASLLAGGFGLGLHPFLGDVAQIGEQARRFEALTGVRALAARNHHLGWRGFVDVPAAEAAAGVAVNLDAMTVCDGTHPCAAFAGGSVRPMRFIDADGRALPILQQPTAVDDYSLRERDDTKRAAAATALGARAHALLDVAARAGGPLVVNAHPVFVALAPDWLRPLVDDGAARVWSVEAWLDFVARRRASRITMPRCDAPPIAQLPTGVTLR